MSSSNTANSYLSYGFLVLYILTGTLSNFGAIDILAPQWVYLCLVNILCCIHLLYNRSSFYFPAFKLTNLSVFWLYTFYILWAALSILYAFNTAETIINFPRYFNVYVGIFFSVLLLFHIKHGLTFISTVLSLFLTAEVLLYFNQFLEQISSSNFNSLLLKGFSGNKNIAAASMVIKIPFLIYFFNRTTKPFFRLAILVLLSLAYIALTIIYARTALLSSTLFVILYTAYQLYRLFTKEVTIKRATINSLIFLVPFVIAYFTSDILSSKYNTQSYSNRVQSIGFTRAESSGRFNYWESALQSFIENPIIGSGLGNFKIKSISYGSEYIKGYTVPYHAHNDFIHTATELGILGFLSYLGIFVILLWYLIKLYLNDAHKNNQTIAIIGFLSIMGYGIDASLNFPVARPLMQSALVLISALIISQFIKSQNIESSNAINTKRHVFIYKSSLGVVMLALLGSMYVLLNSFNALTQQGRLLYEFNNGTYKLTLNELAEIDDDFPNLTETAMPIKAMKARYFYNNGRKEEAKKLIKLSMKDNPYIGFPENLLAQFYLMEQKMDSAHFYAKKSFERLPNNMPHYDLYMKTLVAKRDILNIHATFERVKSIAGDTKIVWLIYIRSLAQTTSLGDPFSMSKASEAYRLFPDDETIYTLYRILTYGQQRVLNAESLYNQGVPKYESADYLAASSFFTQAFDEDPLNYSYSLNAGLAFYESKDYEKAIKYLDLTLNSKKPVEIERAYRFKALSLLYSNRRPEGCAVYLKLKNNFPKRMYEQEFQKFCLRSN